MRRVYLDHQAATPLRPEVLAAMKPYFMEAFGSASSLHQHGLRARDALATAREQLARLIHAPSPEDIVFTSDGTEAVNLAIKGTAWANQRVGNHLVVSATEHPAVMNSVEFLEQHGFACTRVPVNGAGQVDPGQVQAALTERTILIAVHHVNHDLGAIQPVAAIGEIAAGRGIPFLVDAEASVGWMPVDVAAMGASLLTFSPHRFYGPKGVGVLYRNPRARLTPLLHGGNQEGGRRAGTENVPAIVGAGAAAALAVTELAARGGHTARLQQRLWAGICATVPFVKLNGPPPGPERIGTNLNVSAEFTEGEGQMLLLDLQGIAVASGSACLGRALKLPPVLAAIGLPPALAQANIIVSLGQDNTEEDADYFIQAYAKVVAKLRGMSPAWEEFQRSAGESTAGAAH